MQHALYENDSIFTLRLPGGTVGSIVAISILSFILGLFGLATHPIIIAVLVVGVAIMMAVFVNPVFPLILFFLVLYTRPAELFPPLAALKLGKLTMVGCMLSAFIQYWIVRREKLVKSPMDFWLNGFVIMMIVSFIGSIDPAESFNNFSERFSKVVMMVFFIKNIIDTKKKLIVFSWVLVVLSLVLAGMAIKNVITGENLVGELERVQLTGIMGDPNDLALAIVITIPFMYRFIACYKNWGVRIFLIIILGLGLFTIKATVSRGGLLGFGTVTYLTMIIGRPRKTKLLITLGLLSVMVIMVGGGIGVRNDAGASDSANSRFLLWEAGIRMALASPIWGQGLANYKYKSNYYMTSYGASKTAHSIFFLVLGEMGFVGFFFYIGMLFTQLKLAFQLHKLARMYPENSPLRGIGLSCFTSFVGFIVCGLTLSQSYTWFPYIIISITIVANRILAWDLGYQKYYHIVQWVDKKVDEQVYA